VSECESESESGGRELMLSGWLAGWLEMIVAVPGRCPCAALKLLPRGCTRGYRCAPSTFHHALNSAKKCTRCRSIYTLDVVPNLAITSTPQARSGTRLLSPCALGYSSPTSFVRPRLTVVMNCKTRMCHTK
jgi:hypothetical protein